jgi:hypothetical protein
MVAVKQLLASIYTIVHMVYIVGNEAFSFVLLLFHEANLFVSPLMKNSDFLKIKKWYLR